MALTAAEKMRRYRGRHGNAVVTEDGNGNADVTVTVTGTVVTSDKNGNGNGPDGNGFVTAALPSVTEAKAKPVAAVKTAREATAEALRRSAALTEEEREAMREGYGPYFLRPAPNLTSDECANFWSIMEARGEGRRLRSGDGGREEKRWRR